MKFAICNEPFGDRPAVDTFSTIAKLGYTGVEVAPFTLMPGSEPFDVRRVLAKTQGLYLTSPDPTVRRRTAEYLRALVELCTDLGGKLMVLGSPQQRNL